MSEICQRCKEEGEDNRTLWMACFYEMSELGLPFRVNELESLNRKFYTLYVCKSCRADWMRAIKTWFKHAPEREEGVEAGANKKL